MSVGAGGAKHLGYIDAVRGVAILLVLIVHSQAMCPHLPGYVATPGYQGARGVQLFFLASALTLMLAWHGRQDGASPFFVRRLFRIAPMFWLAIPFYLWIFGTGVSYWAPNGIHAWQIALTTLFLHGFNAESINSVVPGGWSIAVEATFYAIFPILAISIRSWFIAVIACALSFTASDYINDYFSGLWQIQSHPLLANFTFLWFPNQMPAFLTGILLYFAIRDTRIPRTPLATVFLEGLLAATLALIVRMAYVPLPIPLIQAYTIVFAVFIFCLSNGAGNYINTLPIRFLGKISYSAYLWQFAVLWLLGNRGINQFNPFGSPGGFVSWLFVLGGLLIIVTAAAWSTYIFIERPFISLGAYFIRGMVSGRAAIRAETVETNIAPTDTENVEQQTVKIA